MPQKIQPHKRHRLHQPQPTLDRQIYNAPFHGQPIQTEQLGLIPFRRLLLIENIIDLGDLKVRDAMRSSVSVRVIRLDAPWAENLRMISDTHFSRYPVVEHEGDPPLGVLHVKNIPFADPPEQMTADRLRRLARPGLKMREDMPLEDALARFQQRYDRLALVVNDNGECTGILTFEDVLQEIVGTMGDEFELGRAGQLVSLVDALSPGRILLDLHAGSMHEAIRELIAHIPREELPADPEAITRVVRQRERVMPIYIGSGLAIPHGRLDGIGRPVLAFARFDEGVPLETTNERAELFFLLLTPSRMARIQPRLLATIAGLFKSEYVTERLRKAQTPEAIIEAIRAGQQVALD